MTFKRFPRRRLRSDAELYRIHRRARSAWWFSSDGTGRFDPVGTGMGACYLAEKPLGAWIEVFRREMVLSELAVRERALARPKPGRELRLADLTSRRALQFGATASLGANEDYAASQEFAVGVLQDGFAGIRYFLRHDPAQTLYGVALFGEPGEPATRDRLWRRPREGPIPDELVEEATRSFGYRIVPAP